MFGCGLLETPKNFFVDHLAPLCSFLDFPILSSRAETIFFYRNYYPETRFLLKNWHVKYLVENFSAVLYSFNPHPTFREIIAKENFISHGPEKTKFLHHFHGCSDKGYHSPWIRPDGHFKEIDLLFIYGKRTEDLLRDKNLLSLPGYFLHTGNYRKVYYEKHRHFYDALVEKEIFSRFARKQKTILYAPTWNDPENSSSVFSVLEPLLVHLPDSVNLIVKLHPRMQENESIVTLLRPHQKKKNLLFLPFYPLLYPLLSRIDLYLGDYSSVGYDALSFDIPLYFLNHNERELSDRGAFLFRTGLTMPPSLFSNPYPFVFDTIQENRDTYRNIRRETYRYAFGKDPSYEELKNKLLTAVRSLS